MTSVRGSDALKKAPAFLPAPPTTTHHAAKDVEPAAVRVQRAVRGRAARAAALGADQRQPGGEPAGDGQRGQRQEEGQGRARGQAQVQALRCVPGTARFFRRN
jgi:hypothetical protein